MTPGEREMLDESVMRHEGFRSRAYQDTLGHWTIGYGTNLEALKIDEPTARGWMQKKLLTAEQGIAGMPGFREASGPRQAVLVEMAYQLGVKGCLRFVKMWEAVAAGDWTAAAQEMLASKWAQQTPGRVAELAVRLESGTWYAPAGPA